MKRCLECGKRQGILSWLHGDLFNVCPECLQQRKAKKIAEISNIQKHLCVSCNDPAAIFTHYWDTEKHEYPTCEHCLREGGSSVTIRSVFQCNSCGHVISITPVCPKCFHDAILDIRRDETYWDIDHVANCSHFHEIIDGASCSHCNWSSSGIPVGKMHFGK